MKKLTIPTLCGVLLSLCFLSSAQADNAGMLAYYSCDEASGTTLKDAGPNVVDGHTNAVADGRVNGAGVLVPAADVWTPLLTSDGIQHKNVIPGSDAVLAGDERPIVLDRDKDYAIDYKKGLLKALPGGRMEIGQVSTIDYKYSNDGPQRVDGKIGRGLKFDGYDDFAWLGHIPPATRLNAVTLQLWVYLAKDCSPDALILAKSPADKNGSTYGLRLVNGVLQFFHPSLKTTDNQNVASTQAKDILAPETWFLLTATYDGQSTALYVNGKEVSRQNSLRGNLEGSGEFTIGGTRDPNFFGGIVDDIQIYNRALPAEEIVRCIR